MWIFPLFFLLSSYLRLKQSKIKLSIHWNVIEQATTKTRKLESKTSTPNEIIPMEIVDNGEKHSKKIFQFIHSGKTYKWKKRHQLHFTQILKIQNRLHTKIQWMELMNKIGFQFNEKSVLILLFLSYWTNNYRKFDYIGCGSGFILF